MNKSYFFGIMVLFVLCFYAGTSRNQYATAGFKFIASGNEFAFGDLKKNSTEFDPVYDLDTTRQLIALVKDAADLIRKNGEGAFNEFRLPGSRWRHNDTYIFVLDLSGNMLVNADAALEGKNQMNLTDINGKPIVRGLIAAATSSTSKQEGWYHYEWTVPGGLLPRWKSSFVQLVKTPSGKSYVVGSGIYNDRMEREFVVDAVNNAVLQIEKNKADAFKMFHDPSGQFMVKDAYIFVVNKQGIELVNPAFPNLEGRKVLDVKDSRGKMLVREMLDKVEKSDSGWVDYMWPKPGESVSTTKSTYVRKAKVDGQWVMVGCGVYLADAPKETPSSKMNAQEMMLLVRDAAKVFEQKGEMAYPEFRKRGTKWFTDNTYFFVWSMGGVRVFHAADSSLEGIMAKGIKDANGRPYGKMFLDAASSPGGEGWVHYMFPEPGAIFPAWKSSFIKRVTFPSGQQYLVGCGIYNMQIGKEFIEDVVDRAALLVSQKGRDAFPLLRDKTGPFIFMDTYVFVDGDDGTELVNPAQPSLEGKNMLLFKDLNGKYVIKDYIDAALKNDSAWVEYYWYRPGQNEATLKKAFVRKVKCGKETLIVGSGYYPAEENKTRH